MMFASRLNLYLYENFVYFMPFLMAIGIGITPVLLSMFSVYMVLMAVGVVVLLGGCSAIVMLQLHPQVHYVAYGVVVIGVSMGIFVLKHMFVYPNAWQGTPRQVQIEGTLKSAHYAPHKTQMRLQNATVDGVKVSGDIRLNVKNMPLPYAKNISLKARLYPPAKPIIPDAFDFRTFATYNGISAFGKGVGNITVTQTDSPGFAYGIAKHIYTYMSPRIGAIAIALITGNRVGMQADDVQALRGSGLAHLLAISGLHLGLVMGVVYMFMRTMCCLIKPYFFTAYPIKQYAAVVSLIVALLYCIIADFPTPTVRAFLMGAIVVLGVLTHRKSFTIRSVSIVASLILLIQPESLFSVSFQLSFIAVLGLVAVFSYVPARRGVRAMIYHVCIASIVAMCVTLPFSAYHFGTVAVYSVLANMVAVPMMALCIAPLLLVSVFEYMILHTGYSLYAVEWVLSWLIQWAYIIYDLPNSVYYTGHIPIWGVLVFVMAMGGAIHTTYKKTGIAIMGLTIVGVLLYPSTKPHIIISRQGDVAILQEKSYIIPNRNNVYFINSVRKQTGVSVFVRKKCRGDCVINGMLYTKKKYPIQGICTDSAYRFIIAPNAILKSCTIPSFDKADHIINNYEGMKIFIKSE